jgi:hypothetical protein
MALAPRAGYVVLVATVLAIAFSTVRVFAAALQPDPHRAAGAFVGAVNRGDWGAACRMYSGRYLKVSQAECRRFWWWGWRFYGPYTYKLVRAHRTGGRYHVELTRRGGADFVDFAHEGGGWKVVAGGW